MADLSNQVQTNQPQRGLVCPMRGWPREIVVDHGDGTVSLFANVSHTEGEVRGRRVDDVFRELM